MRLIFNTTYIVEENIETEWQDFMREQYIAYLRRQQFVQDVLFTKVSIDQPDGKTYSLQVVFDTPESLEHFTQHHVPLLEEKITDKYKNRYLCFSSTLTEI